MALLSTADQSARGHSRTQAPLATATALTDSYLMSTNEMLWLLGQQTEGEFRRLPCWLGRLHCETIEAFRSARGRDDGTFWRGVV